MKEQEKQIVTPLSIIDREYGSYFIDPKHMGKFLGEGLRTRVYELTKDFDISKVRGQLHDPKLEATGIESLQDSQKGFVVKIPKTEALLFPSLASKKLEDFKMAIKHFQPYVVDPTYILSSERQKSYCILQRKLERFENISPKNIGLVQQEINDLFLRHKDLVKKGLFLSVLGKDGIVSCLKALKNPHIIPFMSNAVIEYGEEKPQLKIHDITIVPLSGKYYNQTFQEQAHRLFNFLLFRLDRKLIAKHFGIDFG